jgi:uncharacterized protein YndB with AHSA1/START domain
MSKKKKVVTTPGKKSPAKKVVKKTAIKPSPKKNAAKKPSKPTKTNKAKPAVSVKKNSGKAAKPIKKSAGKASTPKNKTAAKIIVKNNKPKKVIVKKPVPSKKTEVKKKVLSKKSVAKTSSKPLKSVKKTVKPAAKPTSRAVAPKPKTPARAVKAVPKKTESPKAKTPAKTATRPLSPPVSKPAPLPAAKVKKAEEPALSKSTGAEKKPAEVLAITNTIPVQEKHEISLSKIASISHSITNPIKRTDSYAVKPEKEPPGKFEMEFVVHASAEMLYEFLSTPSGLSEWFCDDLNIRNGIYTFIWEDQLQQARLLKTVDLQLVRFQWVDKTDGSYFEFRIQRDDLTNDISLIITDFADSAGDRESSKLLWNSQVEKLLHVIGSIF